ncbi:DoxX protein [Rubrobacter tropicus]|uniref:DoxX protein n=1 Tax=Rubrobacter tropicus TaxID=2653851 RepID=A0A6G8QDI1_9ACTN|nr:DoxX protein [Rubrobacter tropicus]QIN84555.1 DoxX protein [Rubrobacter tropicus]
MKFRGRLLSGTVATAALLVASAGRAHAHEKWFVGEADGGLRLDLLFRPLPLTLVGAVLLATLVGGLLWKTRGRGFLPGPEAFGATDGGRSVLYGLVPLILGIHVAVPLLVNGVQGTLFSPDNVMPGVWGNFLGLAETGIALALFYGGLTRVAAAALGLLWFFGIFLVGLEPMLENVLYLGFAAFFLLAGRGPLSVDRLLFPRLEPRAELSRYAVPAVRIGVGLSLAIVAFTEKFANIPLGLTFLEEYPLNFTGALGVPLSDEVFVLCAGAVELLVGLWIALGIFVREIVVVAWFPINLTLTLFAWEELIGHLPIYGVMAVLLIWATGPKNISLWTKGMRERLLPLDPSTGDDER